MRWGKTTRNAGAASMAEQYDADLWRAQGAGNGEGEGHD